MIAAAHCAVKRLKSKLPFRDDVVTIEQITARLARRSFLFQLDAVTI